MGHTRVNKSQVRLWVRVHRKCLALGSDRNGNDQVSAAARTWRACLSALRGGLSAARAGSLLEDRRGAGEPARRIWMVRCCKCRLHVITNERE